MTGWWAGMPSTVCLGCPRPCRIQGTCSRPCSASSTPPWRCSRWTGRAWALEHEDGSLRWVVVTDGAAGLLEDTQRDLGEGPGLAAYGDAAAVVVTDLATDRRFPRLAAAVTPRGLRGVLVVPVAVAGRPVGALSVYATAPCPWSGIDVAAVGAYAGVVAELLRAAMALGARDAEVAELTRALTARGRRSVPWPMWPARWCRTPSGPDRGAGGRAGSLPSGRGPGRARRGGAGGRPR
jgi:GAF domain